MKLSVDENKMVVIKEIYNPIILKTNSGEEISICMRDSGFEFVYEGEWYTAQKGKIKKFK